MGITIKHNRGTKIILSKEVDCKAKSITSILSSTSWKDKKCFILGGGPSLTHFDFNLIKDELTIGVNKSFTRFSCTINYGMDMGFYDKLTYSYSSDSRLIKLHQQWLEYSGIKVFLKRPRFKLDSSVYVVNDIKEKTLSFDLEKGIYGGNNSGFGALMLAITLGATKIGLLGYDLKVDNQAKKTHWHSGYIHQRFDTMQSKLDKFKMPFNEFSEAIVQQGIEVINLNPDSALNCFPFGTLEDF